MDCSINAFVNFISQCPTVDAVPVVHGEWEECDWVQHDGHFGCEYRPKEGVRCSNCGYAFKKNLLWVDNFCPNCGADMRKKEEK